MTHEGIGYGLLALGFLLNLGLSTLTYKLAYRRGHMRGRGEGYAAGFQAGRTIQSIVVIDPRGREVMN